MSVRRKKHSQWAAVLANNEARETNPDVFQILGPGSGFSFLESRPLSPPVAHLFRRYAFFWDAVRAWRAESPPHQEDLSESDRRDWDVSVKAFQLKNEPADRILEALGTHRDDYTAAKNAILRWCEETRKVAGLSDGEPAWLGHSDARIRVLAEIERTILPLLCAYTDPQRFFGEIAPKVDEDRLFDPAAIGPFEDCQVGKLGQTLYTWGFGALLNSAVRDAFYGAAKDAWKMGEVLAQAEARRAYSEGRKAGSKDGRPRDRRVDGVKTRRTIDSFARRREATVAEPKRWGRAAAVKAIARRDQITPSAVRKRVERSSRKK